MRAVLAARRRQVDRDGILNSGLGPERLQRESEGAPEATRLLTEAAERFYLSARTCHRILRVARTIADLSEEPGRGLLPKDVAEALAMRMDEQSPG